ncbi:uncharacterized protein LOC144098020 [Amblyomma americanum]
MAHFAALATLPGAGPAYGVVRQVSSVTSLYAKKSNDVCLLLFPCPGVLLCVFSECFDIVNQLLALSGDVELNPGPNTRHQVQDSLPDVQSKQLEDMFAILETLNTRSAKMQLDQKAFIKSIDDLKNSQLKLEDLSEMNERLTNVERKTVTIDETEKEVHPFQQLVDQLSSENSQLRARLPELEDRQRRDNLLFYGMPDAQSESWAQSEEKLVKVLSSCLEILSSEILIDRAHRLGGFASEKCRPIIAKFSSFKVKQRILLNCSKLKDEKITLSEDFSLATRHARKQLVGFGKSQPLTFKLRFNKLYIKNKCYSYNHSDDSVHEIPSASRCQPTVTVDHVLQTPSAGCNPPHTACQQKLMAGQGEEQTLLS